MPFPKLSFVNRRAQREGKYFYQCERVGHRRMRRSFDHRSDREDGLQDHDRKYHSGTPPSEAVSLGTATDQFLADLRVLVARNERSEKTYRYYAGIAANLVAILGHSTPIPEIRQQQIAEFIREFRSRSESRGSRIRKHLSSLRTITTAAGHVPQWTYPKNLKVAHQEIKPPDTDTLIRFWLALPQGSVEKAYVTLKWIVTMRNVEISAANVGDVDLLHGTLRYEMHLRVEKRWRSVYLPPFLLDMLRPWVHNRRPDEPLLHLRGKRLGESTLRKRFIAASERANIQPPITAVAQLRHGAFRKVRDELGPYVAQQLAGHASIRTTEGYMGRLTEPSPDSVAASFSLADLLSEAEQSVN